MIDPLRPDDWTAARAKDCRGRRTEQPPELGRFGAAAAAAAPRLHNRRLGGVLGRLKGRSSILGHYSGPDALGVRAFRLGGCRESGWSAVRLSYAVSRPLPPSRPFRGCPLPPEAIPNSPLALAHPACVRPVALPPTGHSLPRAKSEGRADFCARWRVRGAPPISPRAALSGTALLRIDEELTAAGEIDQDAGQIDHPPAVDCPQTA